MSQGSISQGAAGELLLSGVLDHLTGATLREAGRKLIQSASASSLVLDCSAVEKSSSVGLSLLLAFMRDARAVGKSLAVRGLPSDMQEIARVSGLHELLACPA